MYELFNLVPNISSGVLSNAKWMYLGKCLKGNLDKVIHYYRTNPSAVKSQNFLVRLLHAINVPINQELSRFYSNVDAIALNVSKTMGMTSSLSKGNLFKGVFYGKENREVLIADDSSFDYVDANLNWEDLAPIRVLRHPRSDLNLNLPDGINSGVETGIAVISINITMLMVQYRAFRIEELRKAYIYGTPQHTMIQFLHMYVLPNMLRSHLDVALFNRIYNLLFGIPFGAATIKHSFFLVDYEKEVTAFQEDLLKNLHLSVKSFYDVLRTIPAISDHDMSQVMTLPYVAPTRQVVWGLTLSRLQVLRFLMHLAKTAGHTKNQTEINQLKRKLLEYRTDQLFKNLLPTSLYLDIETELNDLGL